MRRTCRSRSLTRSYAELTSCSGVSRSTLFIIHVIRSFANAGTQDIFDENRTKRASKTCPSELWEGARTKLDLLNQAYTLNDLRVLPGNRLEKLRGDRQGQHSIRINRQFRICFIWADEGPAHVEITDYH